MNKNEYSLFEKNNLKNFWIVANYSWVFELYNSKLIKLLNKASLGKKLFNMYHKLHFFITQKPSLPLLEYIITTRCTMNCKECNTKIPEYTKNHTHTKITSFDEFKKDIDTILKSVGFIDYLGIVGGEPLLAPDLAKIIEYAARQKQIHHVFVATNATILPNESVLKAMKNKKVSVQVSDYRSVKNLKEGVVVKYEEYLKLLKDNRIKFNNFQEKRNATTWFSMPEIYEDMQDDKKVLSTFSGCFATHVNMLCEGIMYQCMLSVYMHHNLKITPEMQEEIVNIREEQSSKKLSEKIISFYIKPFSKYCHWCHFENIQHGLPCGEQV